jgi:hypothetical protein
LVTGCSASTGIEVSSNASPGDTLASPGLAANIFAEACLTTAPGFENVSQKIAGRPFVRSRETGIYFHKQWDLSVNVSDYGCTLVFRSESTTDDIRSEISNSIAKSAKDLAIKMPGNISITSIRSPVGAGRYYRVGLPRP